MPDDRPEILIYPPIAFGIAMAASYGIYLVYPLPFALPFGPQIGVALCGCALVVGASGAGMFRQIGTPISPHKAPRKLATGGIFRLTRNPMYLSLTAILLSCALMFSNAWAALVTPLLWGTLHWGVVLPEERFLTQKFGDEYRELLSSTRRWL